MAARLQFSERNNDGRNRNPAFLGRKVTSSSSSADGPLWLSWGCYNNAGEGDGDPGANGKGRKNSTSEDVPSGIG